MPAPTPPSPITQVPTPPNRSAPTEFSDRMDAMLAALPDFVDETNEVATYNAAAVVYIDAQITGATTTISAVQTTAVNAVTSAQNTAVAAVEAAEDAGVAAVNAVVAAAGFAGTSTTSMSVGTGTKNLTTQTGLAFRAGSFVELADNAAPTTNYMIGTVTSYDIATGAMVANITHTGGSGTKTSWIVVMTGKPGSDASVTLANVESAVGGAVSLQDITTETVSTTTYTVVAADRGKIKKFTNASGCAVTLPATLAEKFNCAFKRALTAGAVTLSAGSGAVIENVDGDVSLGDPGAVAAISVDSNSGGSAAVITFVGRTS